MEATKVITKNTPAIRAVLRSLGAIGRASVADGDPFGEDIDMPAPACERTRDH